MVPDPVAMPLESVALPAAPVVAELPVVLPIVPDAVPVVWPGCIVVSCWPAPAELWLVDDDGADWVV